MKPWYIEASLDWSDDSIRLIATPSFTAKQMLFHVQEVGYLRAFSTYFTERQHLDSYLIVYTVKGKGRLQYRDRDYEVHPGEAFFIDCREYQYYRTVGEQGWELFFVHFYGNSSHDYFKQFDRQYIQNKGPVIALNGDANIPNSIKQMILAQQHRNIQTELWNSKYITDMLTTLLSHSLMPDHKAEMGNTPTYIEKITKYIDLHYNKKLTLDVLASQIAYSKYHLHRGFKRYIGLTPYEYQLNSRMNTAKELLKYSQQSVEEIAHLVGIEQVSHFIHLFKKQEECTPLAYRKMWQK